jgi:hypothetical protein
MYLIISRKDQIIFKNYKILLAKIYIHVQGGGENTIGVKNRSAQMGEGGIAGTQPNECNVICNIYLWKPVTDVY